jgi:DNA replication protein DnaD
MARPQKDGLDYFPVVTSFDDNMELIISEFGPEGLGIVIGLYQRIYANGYYMDWNEDTLLLFATKHINAEITRINSVLMRSFDRKIFNKELYDKFGILTSRGIQKQFLRVCKTSRRKSVPFIKEYCLITQNDELFGVITELTLINSEELQQNDVVGTQSKEKEKEKEKVKESKEKERDEETPAPPLSPKTIELVSYYEHLKPGQSISAHVGFLAICIEKYGIDWTKEAIRVCVSNKNQFIKPYIETVLMNWKAEGGPNLEKERGQPSNSIPKNVQDALDLVKKYEAMEAEGYETE